MRTLPVTILLTLLITIGIVFYELKRYDPMLLSVQAVHLYLSDHDFDTDTLVILPDTNNQSYESLKEMLGISDEIYQILPAGHREEDVQVVDVQSASKSVFYFVIYMITAFLVRWGNFDLFSARS